MARTRPDFVNIRLSAAGAKMAGEGRHIGWANGRRHFAFKVGEEQEVERSYEWNHLLRHEMFEGEPILEEVPEEASDALAEPLRTIVTEEPGEGD